MRDDRSSVMHCGFVNLAFEQPSWARNVDKGTAAQPMILTCASALFVIRSSASPSLGLSKKHAFTALESTLEPSTRSLSALPTDALKTSQFIPQRSMKTAFVLFSGRWFRPWASFGAGLRKTDSRFIVVNWSRHSAVLELVARTGLADLDLISAEFSACSA